MVNRLYWELAVLIGMDGRAVVKYLFGSTSSRPRMWWLGIGPSATVTGKHSR
jgi:hypothetical protein